MKRIAATTLLAMGLLQVGSAAAQNERAVSDAAATDESPAAKAAGEQARNEAARQLRAQASEFTIVAVEAAQWSDSSLGCRRPGSMYSQVMTSGYTVVLERQGKRHQVNVAGSRAVLCEAGGRVGGVARQPLRARGLDQMMRLARQDLANRLRLDAEHIRVVKFEPQRWTDDDMNCRSGGGVAQSELSGAAPGTASSTGFRLTLSASGRTFSYHTDMKSVRPCPPIEDQ
jgi:hypothetical protein